jgi:hypothetical protein
MAHIWPAAPYFISSGCAPIVVAVSAGQVSCRDPAAAILVIIAVAWYTVISLNFGQVIVIIAIVKFISIINYYRLWRRRGYINPAGRNIKTNMN